MRKPIIVAAAAAAVAVSCAVAALWIRRSARRWSRVECIVRELNKRCATPVERLWDVADSMMAEMRAGLAAEGSLRMLPCLLNSLPTGEEEGSYYGMKLGRAKLRLLHVQLGGKDARVVKKGLAEVPVPINLMVDTSQELYEYMAAELGKFFLEEEKHSDRKDGTPAEVAVSMSFPVVQNSASAKTIVEWSQGFSIKEKDGEDAVGELNEAIEKLGHNMRTSLVVNETIGTLAGGRYYCGDTVAAVVLGMRTNAAYLESEHAVPKWQSAHHRQGEMVINIEWGNFQSIHLPITDFDVCVDNESPNPREMIYAKLISGMYLGEIVRQVLLKITEETSLFGDDVPSKLKIPFILRTSDMAYMHQDRSADLVAVGEKLSTLGIPNTTLRMREIVFEVCDIIAKRGARLAAAGIVGILKHLGRDGTDKKAVVMVEGGVYEHYRLFRNYLHDGVKVMLRGRFSDNVVIEHGCGLGAALLAAANSNHGKKF
ncbi:hexokinase-2-like [Dioscorea cayenensis subsp. rotundata]|uniref:Phosphotransferase n=1 Tax=Dioscorea cayennensis subsp. rotundata TaxID=55577 RepID=A0AB40CNV8_DIOCR|nr:hexokinase-2-like [Dioscorea cayenensis subsp. rotundata]